jgi:hypothetical protein
MEQAVTESDVDLDLLLRVYGEYNELPGLQLTPAQAARLFGTSVASGREVLDELVGLSFLSRNGAVYVRTR